MIPSLHPPVFNHLRPMSKGDVNQMSSPIKTIPVALPVMDEREVEAAKRPIMSGWVTQGPEVAAFEREFSDYVGSKHACAVSNCTTALHLALLAVGVKPGDEVVTVSHSFVATANSVRYCGAKPVFVDIEPGTFNMDPGLIERVLSPSTKAVLCVHQMGMPCDMAAIARIARQNGLPVVEDAACAIGSEILWDGKWEKVGKPHGDVACFSFHPRKVITTGDGGMITTNNKDWDDSFRLLRVHGMSMDSSARHGAGRVAFESYLELGFNYRMTDIQAAIGREQLKRLPGIVAHRRELGDRYRKVLARPPRGDRSLRAALGPQQLAKLLRASSRRVRPTRGHAGNARRRSRDPTRHHVFASRAGLYRAGTVVVRCRPGELRLPARQLLAFAGKRKGPGSMHPAAALSSNDRERSRPCDPSP